MSDLPSGNRVRQQSMTSASQDSSVSIVHVTGPVPGAENLAKKLAGSLVECKLAACANIVPGVTSVYWWEGKIEKYVSGPQQERLRYELAIVVTVAKRSLLAENSDCCPISFKMTV
ncbi:hypothetical protein WJX82_005795 [Trebouxia sp. C0006]